MNKPEVRIGPNNTIELVANANMTPLDAGKLALGLLAGAAVLSVQQSPSVGSSITDAHAHFLILKWEVTRASISGNPVLVLSIPPGVDLVFQTRHKSSKDWVRH